MSTEPIVDTPAGPRRRSAGRRVTPDRQQRILDAAVDIAVEEGFKAVTMQSVARRADYVRPVVYDCFGTPENLVLAALEREGTVLLAELERVSDTITDMGPASFNDVSKAVVAQLESMREQPKTWLLFSVPTEGTSEAVQQRMVEMRGAIRQCCASNFDRATANMAGQGRDIEVASHLIQEVADALGQRILSNPEAFPPRRIHAFVDSILASVGASSTAGASTPDPR